MAKAVYKGFSTKNFLKNRSFRLNNLELVKQDLLLHIYTQLGSRLMMPSFGTRIPVIVFEPNDQTTTSIIEADITAVINYDPRVKLEAFNIVSLPNNNAIVAIVNILYIEFNVSDVLHIEIQAGS